MGKTSERVIRRGRRKKGIRRNGVFGTPSRPRLSVNRSLKHMYAQIIDDLSGRTLASASTCDKAFSHDGSTSNAAAASAVGTLLAERAGAAGLKRIQFDRNGLRYHGRVKALADAARKGGLEF